MTPSKSAADKNPHRAQLHQMQQAARENQEKIKQLGIEGQKYQQLFMEMVAQEAQSGQSNQALLHQLQQMAGNIGSPDTIAILQQVFEFVVLAHQQKPLEQALQEMRASQKSLAALREELAKHKANLAVQSHLLEQLKAQAEQAAQVDVELMQAAKKVADEKKEKPSPK